MGRDAASCKLLASTGAVRTQRRPPTAPTPASLRGIDRKPKGGAAGGARHRMITLIRADGRLGKRVVTRLVCSPEVVLRKSREGWKPVLLTRGGVSTPVLVTGMAQLPANQLPHGEPSTKCNPCESATATPMLLPTAPAVIELSLSFDFEETHQSVVRGALKRAGKLLPIRGVIAII